MKHLLLHLLGLLIFPYFSFSQVRLEVEGDAKIQGKIELLKAVGDSSLFIGPNAGLNDNGENENVFIGPNAGRENSSGRFNTFIGVDVGMEIDRFSNDNNTFIGYQAGARKSGSTLTTFLGYQAGMGTGTGGSYNNTFIGGKSGLNNKDGEYNTFVGTHSGADSELGSNNTFIGVSAGRNNINGGYNTFLGRSSGNNSTEGEKNTYLGADANSIPDSLDRSIAIGYQAKVDCHSCAVIGGIGEDAVKLGIGTQKPSDAQFTVLSEEFDDFFDENIAVFKHGAGSGTFSGFANIKLVGNGRPGIKFVDEGNGSNESDFMVHLNGVDGLVIVNADNTSDEFETFSSIAKFETLNDTYQFTVYGDALASGGVFTNSDLRLKKDIKALNNALSYLHRLQPKKYKYDYKNQAYHRLNLPQEKQFGLIAQEVEKILPEIVKTQKIKKDNGNDTAQSTTETNEIYGLKSINYTALIPLLIGGIQEQQEILDKQQRAINNQTESINRLESEMERLKSTLARLVNPQQNDGKDKNYILPLKQKGFLSQNQPNPFNQSTTITFFIPEGIHNAAIQITTLDGKLLEKVNINSQGEGRLNLKTDHYPTGTYLYSLILGGQIFETKRMVLMK